MLRKHIRWWLAGFGALGLIGAVSEGISLTRVAWAQETHAIHPVSSGRILTPIGDHVGVGSFPVNSVLSPDGKFLVTTDTGFRESLSVINLATNKLTETQTFNGRFNSKKDELYYGLVFGKDETGQSVLYASRGGQGQVLRYSLDADGALTKLNGALEIPKDLMVGPVAGIAVDDKTGTVAVAINGATKDGDHHGYIVYFNQQLQMTGKVEVPGYPLDVAIEDGVTYTSCERDGVVAMLTPKGMVAKIKTGANPTKLVPTSEGIWVANSGSDTISLIPDGAKKVDRTIVLRPSELRGLPVSTPLDLTPSQDGKTLYVALADLNAIGVVDTESGSLTGLIPTGWYPTSVKLSPDEKSLFVTSAKGIFAQNPNGKKVGPQGAWGTYSPNIIEGSVSKIDLPAAKADLANLTHTVVNDLHVAAQIKFVNPGIKHVIYIVKENRTYDQVFGDIPEGNGDPSLTMFGEAVTPNEHALAKRFLLLDNFYDCAEVSADGWNWSTSGMVNEYTARNVPNNYSRRRPGYDYEGNNGGIFPDLIGLNDVAEAPGGYIWDDAIKHHVSLRNYGFFVGDVEAKGAKENQKAQENGSTKKIMTDCTDASFRQFDLALADSDLWTKIKVQAEDQMTSFGLYHSNSRFAEWKREFDGYVKNKNFPGLSLVRLPRDHTEGTAPGNWSPKAMVADNDYAVGEIVDAVSHSPYWKSTAIFVIEDDSQSGTDHVDCHRSTALVISPYLEKGGKDSAFYNTDSVLHTIELVLGIPPMNGFDALAPSFRFSKRATNLSPYEAIMPDAKIAGELNGPNAYRAADSARLINRFHEETAADLELNDILWHSIMGNRPMPKSRGSAFADHDDD